MAGKRKWTKEKIIQEASKYKTKQEFRKSSGAANKAMYTLGIADELAYLFEKPTGKSKGPAKPNHFEDSLKAKYPLIADSLERANPHLNADHIYANANQSFNFQCRMGHKETDKLTNRVKRSYECKRCNDLKQERSLAEAPDFVRCEYLPALNGDIPHSEVIIATSEAVFFIDETTLPKDFSYRAIDNGGKTLDELKVYSKNQVYFFSITSNSWPGN